jgi:hypothetical protein
MKKFLAAMFTFVALMGVSGCGNAEGAGTPSGQSQIQETKTAVGIIDLTEQQISEGFEYWEDSQEFIYRWATDAERDEITCYSTYCTYIQVIAADSCKSIAYEWSELDASGATLSERSNGLSNVEDPEAEVLPGIGFVLSDMSQTETFLLTSMKCSSGDYDWSKKRDGNSDRESFSESEGNVQQPAENSKVELPSFIGYSTKQAEYWIRSNGFKYRVHASTKLGMNYDVGCQVNNQDSILTQRPAAGSLVEDIFSTVVWLEINC